MLYIALLHCSRTMLDLIFVQVEITGFSWSRCLSVGGTIGANQARHLGKNTWQVLTNAIQMQWLVPHHATFSDLTFICPSSREQIYTNHEVRQITRELHQDRLNDVARWTVERSFFSFLNSLLHVDSNVPCGKSCRSRCQFRWLIVIPDRETQEACGVFRGSCRWQFFPGWWQRQELAFHPGWYTIMTNDCHLCWHPFAMES